jgi:uncharacterized protein (DUF2147 family)
MIRSLRVVSVLIFFQSFTTVVQSQSITGVWKTIDEEGTAKSEIRIWKSGGEYKGKVVEIYLEDKRDGRCTECDEDDPRYNQKVLGMTILNGLKKTEANMWEGGKILDPQNGNVYSCKMWINDEDDLVVRGFIGISLIGRSQTWERID